MGVGWVFMAFFWVLVIAGAIALIRWLGTASNGSRGTQQHQTPLEIIQERYARGEIGQEEYEQKRADLEK
jgi:putative membrane protein